MRTGKADEAKTEYAKLVREGATERMSASKTLAVGKFLGGEEAKECARRLIESDSAEWRQAGHVLLGDVEARAENFTKAVESYRRAMAEDACIADLSPAALALGKLEIDLGEHDKADATLYRAVELNSASPRARAEAYVALAKNAIAKGDGETARKYATVVTSLFADEELCAEANKILAAHPEAVK